MSRALQYGSALDPDLLRAFLRIAGLVSSIDDVFAEPGMIDKVTAFADAWRDEQIMGPSRAELVKLVNA